jgi:hypothetical protein
MIARFLLLLDKACANSPAGSRIEQALDLFYVKFFVLPFQRAWRLRHAVKALLLLRDLPQLT